VGALQQEFLFATAQHSLKRKRPEKPSGRFILDVVQTARIIRSYKKKRFEFETPRKDTTWHALHW
jgi:hypothetical protein